MMILLAVLLLVALPLPAASQATVSVERENFRAAAAGPIVGTVYHGTPLRVVYTDGKWREAALEGWMWSASLRAGPAHSAVVAPASGENLRDVPGGGRIARIEGGTRLDALGTKDRWTHVRLTGWIWAASVEVKEAAAAPAAGRRAATPTDSAGTASPDSLVTIGATGTALFAAPDSDTVGVARPLASVRVMDRQGDWTRIRLDAWVPNDLLRPQADSSRLLTDLNLASLDANPEAFRGRTVEWRLQFIALEKAEPIRQDFQPGEPFILASGPDGQNALVYLAVPARLLQRAGRLQPLQRFVAVGRVRAAHSAQTGAPVLELIDIR
jgi:hypothetical protein